MDGVPPKSSRVPSTPTEPGWSSPTFPSPGTCTWRRLFSRNPPLCKTPRVRWRFSDCPLSPLRQLGRVLLTVNSSGPSDFQVSNYSSRVVRLGSGPVILKSMRFPVSFTASLAVAALSLCAGPRMHAQASQSSSQTPSKVQAPTTGPSPSYIAVDPLANVRYDNKYDVSLGMAYDHMKAGPKLLQGSNLGGLDLAVRTGSAGTGLSKASARLSGHQRCGAQLLTASQGPFVAQYLFVGGPEWLGPHNKHGALIAHAHDWRRLRQVRTGSARTVAVGGRFLQRPGRSGGDYRRTYRPEPLRRGGSSGSRPMR